MVDDLDAVVGRNDGEGFILFRQRYTGSGGRCSEGGNTGNRFDFNVRHQLADDAGEVAESGKSRGIAFNQKDQIAALGE